MTVIRPNSVAGINSITVQSGNSLAVHKANGELIRTITASSGVSTFSTLSVGTATTDNSAAKSINIGLGASISQHTNNTLSFGTGGDERVVIDASGDMGMGTNSPENFGGGHITLEVSGTSTTEGGVFKTATSDSAGSGASGTEMLMFTNNTTGCINVVTVDPLSLYTANTERLRITSGGILGIGTASPYTNGLLHCDGNIVLTASSNAPKIIFDEFGTGTDPKAQIEMDQTDSTNATMRFYTEGSGTLSERLRIDSSGNVTVKTTDVTFGGAGILRINSGSTAGALNLDGGSSNHGGEINLTGGSNGGRIQFRTGQGSGQQSEKMRLDENGRLLIGSTTEGHANADDLTIATSGQTGITIRSGTTSGGNIFFSDATSGTGESAGMISYDHNDNIMTFHTNEGNERFRIGSSGQLGIAGANYGTAGQALLSQGASSAPQWGSVSTSSPTESYAFANLSTTSFDNSGYAVHGISASGGNNGVTVDTTNERLTPTVAGYYYVVYSIVWSHSFSNSGLTAYNGIYKNGSQIASTTIAIYDDAGTKTNEVTALVSMNGSSDYIDFRSYQNKSGQTMSGTNLSRGFMVKLRDN